ncbi:hypothetical protein AGOR_G00079420 [Albula goreensis]|uniref:Uncharacterized protein n=1 Tax=Albula goreensis TaxID=1534307 RepID=A0A8T3DHU9_9TELE|nr:hypothetical protein AGOR_G00079420 [Albula goreensis]
MSGGTGVGSQSSHSSSPCPTTEPSAPPTWSRNLMQQTLMDEGLRLARLVSHDHVGKASPRTQSAENEEKSAARPRRRSSSCSTKDDSDNSGK